MTNKEMLIELYKEEQKKAFNMYLSEYCVSDEDEERAIETMKKNLENFIKILDTLEEK